MQRRLAAILAADMVGYSRLMSADEEGTIERQRQLNGTIINPGMEENGGRIVKTMGDGMLVEFASAVDAVKFAIAVQNAVARAEADSEPQKRIRYRVGINIGDIVVDGDDILGDGVNITARLEAISEPGGICISDAAFQSIKGKIDSDFFELGPQKLKNIEKPVIAWGWQPADTVNQSPAPDTANAPIEPQDLKPSIAVLPFTNMSGDAEQEYFADGMAEDLITELSHMPWFYVTARNTSFTYKGRSVDIKQAGQEMSVAYILEGSVRKSGNRLRITAQLIDTASGNHVWAERYDREITDVFEIQDEITQTIVGAISPEFISSELKKARHKAPDQLDAWECVMRGRAHIWKFAKKDALIAREYFQQAIDASPGGIMGLADLALVHFLDTFYRWSQSPQESMRLMIETARKAVEVDENDPLAHTILAWAHLMTHNWDDAIEAVETAISLSPNFVPAIGVRGAIYACNDEPDIAIPIIKEALARSPRDGFLPFWYMGLFWAFHTIQDYASALDYAKQAVRVAPGNPTFIRQLAVVYAMLGNDEECKHAFETYLELEPSATLGDVENLPVRNQQSLERFKQVLREIGLPEE